MHACMLNEKADFFALTVGPKSKACNLYDCFEAASTGMAFPETVLHVYKVCSMPKNNALKFTLIFHRAVAPVSL
jgi:hypothetical protein